MKKLLALILALVMVMGLATVGTNAALVDYNDVDDFNYEEAIDVMSAVGVLEGFEGKFRPSVELKRSEAAKIVAYLIGGNKAAENLVGTGKFSDVPSNHWAAGYIEYLDSIKVFVGNGNGTCSPDGDLTAVAFAKMLLVALGYDPTIEGLVGNDYQINATKLGTDAGLFKGLSNLRPSDTLTREQAAQMAFNAVKSPLVEYNNRGGSISINGADIAFGASNFSYVTTTIAKDATNISSRQLTNTTGTSNNNSGYTIEFGERYYPDLKLDPVFDGFGRPVNLWTLGKDEIGTYVDEETRVQMWTSAVTGADLVAAYGESKINRTNADDIRYFVNGVEIDYVDPKSTDPTPEVYEPFAIAKENLLRDNKVPYGFTGNGVLTEAFERDEQLIITSIVTYYVEAAADYNPTNETLTYKLFTSVAKDADDDSGKFAPAVANTTFKDNRKISAEKFPEVKTMKADDRFLIRVFRNTQNEWQVGEVLEPKEVKAEQSIAQFSVSNGAGAVVTGSRFTGGYVKTTEQYNFSKAPFLSNNLRDYDDVNNVLAVTYDIVFDPYGYAIAVIENEVADTALFLAGLDGTGFNTAAGSATGVVIFSDGRIENVKINTNKSNDNIRNYMSTTGSVKGSIGEADAADYWVQYAELRNDTGHAYNRWFNYTVSDGLYTLKPIPAGRTQIIDATAGSDGKTGNYINEDGVIQINSSHTRLTGTYINDYDTTPGTTANAVTGLWPGDDGAIGTGGTAAKQAAQTAWYNENTVTITVATAPTSAKMNNHQRANYDRGIAEVTGVYTGIRGVDLVAFEQQNQPDAGKDESTLKQRNPFSSSVYTVFDKNNYIKYAILVGTEAGGNSNLVYATSAAQSQRFDGKYYYWDFKGIVDGEQKVLEVKTEHYGLFSDVKTRTGFGGTGNYGTANAFFTASYDKDGYVTNLVPIEYSDDGPNGEQKNTYNNNDRKDELMYDENDVKYSTYSVASDTLTANGNTLKFGNKGDGNPANGDYTDKLDIGLHVAPGAKIFVVQQSRYTNTNTTSTVISECSSVGEALGTVWAFSEDPATATSTIYREQVGSRNQIWDFNGYVAAALDKSGHLAKWAVIKVVKNEVNVQNNQAVTPNNGPMTVTVNAGKNIRLDGITFSGKVEIAVKMWSQADKGEWRDVGSYTYNAGSDTTSSASAINIYVNTADMDSATTTKNIPWSEFVGKDGDGTYRIEVTVGGRTYVEEFIWFKSL